MCIIYMQVLLDIIKDRSKQEHRFVPLSLTSINRNIKLKVNFLDGVYFKCPSFISNN